MTSTSPAISAVEVLQSLEFCEVVQDTVTGALSYGCPVCHVSSSRGYHASGCRLSAALVESDTATAGPSDEVAELRERPGQKMADTIGRLAFADWKALQDRATTAEAALAEARGKVEMLIIAVRSAMYRFDQIAAGMAYQPHQFAAVGGKEMSAALSSAALKADGGGDAG